MQRVSMVILIAVMGLFGMSQMLTGTASADILKLDDIITNDCQFAASNIALLSTKAAIFKPLCGPLSSSGIKGRDGLNYHYKGNDHR